MAGSLYVLKQMMRSLFLFILFIFLSPRLWAQPAGSHLPYEPHMEEVYLQWEALWDAKDDGCKTMNPCQTSFNYEEFGIPYTLHFRNESSLFRFDEPSIEYVIHRAFSLGLDGYKPVKASRYDGLHSDTLVIVFDINDLGYRMETRAEIELREPTTFPKSTNCESSSDSEVYPDAEIGADSLWSMMLINDFTFGSIVYTKVSELVKCYASIRQLPTFNQFEKRNRASNPWYLRKGFKP